MYIILAFLLAYPALMAELIIGRHTRSNMVTALQSIASSSRAKTAGKLTGLGGILAATFILCFYSIIAGWMIAFMLEPVAHFFVGVRAGNLHPSRPCLTYLTGCRGLHEIANANRCGHSATH